MGQTLALLLLLENFPSLSIAAKRVIPYFHFTKDYHPRYSRGRPGESLELYGYSDASWECQGEGKSIQGYLFKVNSGIVSWSSKKQNATALSTAEAPLSYAVQESF